MTKTTTRRRGNALIEIALIAPLLFFMFFGAVEMGLAMFAKHALQSAARVGAREAAVAETDEEVRKAVEASIKASGYKNVKYTRVVRDAYNGAEVNVAAVSEGRMLEVEVSADWSEFSPMLAGISGVELGRLRGRVVMRRE